MCKLFAYGSADAIATHHLLLQQNPEWFILLVPAYPRPLNACVCVYISTQQKFITTAKT